MHDGFHVSLLKPFQGEGSQVPVLPRLEQQPAYEVEQILAHEPVKVGKRVKLRMLVKWKGRVSDENSYILLEDLPPECVEAYWDKVFPAWGDHTAV
jgi:Chromo (CHRromatin Organisation MOdifier) domain